MRTVTDLRSLRSLRRPAVLAAGFFDGVHRGHRRVLERAVAKAASLGAQPWVLTFDTHPMRILDPAAVPALLTSNEQKLRQFGEIGLRGCLLLPFTRSLAAMPAEAFVRRLRENIPSLREIVVGSSWRFGQRGRGDSGLLKSMAPGLGFAVTVVRPLSCGASPVSSTRVRRAVLDGDLPEAAKLLGRLYSIAGTVVRGHAIGRRLGFPTANLDSSNEILPPAGVYEAFAARGRGHRRGILYIGSRPTFGRARGSKPELELHLLDFRGTLYGRRIEVYIVRRLRGEQRFDSPAALAAQIRRDIARIRRAPVPRAFRGRREALAGRKKKSKKRFTGDSRTSYIHPQQTNKGKRNA
jgi:riboflavin kinase/FMN adenylyltransferase